MAKRIDDSHHGFKRGSKLGPGPKRHELAQERNWECQKGKTTRTEYVQVCRYVGDNKARRGAKMTVRRSKAKKKAYNKLYRRWLKRNARVQAFQKRGAKTGYRCRRTPVASCR